LRRAARGLGLLFIAAALSYLTFVAQVILLFVFPDDPRWLLIPLVVFALLDLLGLLGRLLCLKAKASRQAKMILRVSMLVTLLALLIDTVLAVAGSLLVFEAISANDFTHHVLGRLPYLALLSPLLSVLATVLFLFYIRGLGIALEHYEFGTDALGILMEALLIYLFVPLLVGEAVWGLYFTEVMSRATVLVLFSLPALLLAAFILGLYPFMRYCNLLTRMRDSILWQLDNEAALKPRRHHKPG